MDVGEEENGEYIEIDIPVRMRKGKKSLYKSMPTGQFNDDKDLYNLCMNNGISVKQFESTNITKLEMCHFNYSSMVGLRHFPNLTSLCIVCQDVKDISGLSTCLFLESLWVCETLLTDIKGLGHLRFLKHLYLYSNRIKRIQNLEQLHNLKILSLADNDISVIEGLDHLNALQSLQLGNNKIKRIGDSLNGCTALQELNIAGNLISSFREILGLSKLRNLQRLSLTDPNYSDNPICALCNYQTYIVHHLPNIAVFDTLVVTDESRNAISATIAKKRMYYNMRIVTIRHNSHLLKQLLTKNSQKLIEPLKAHCKELLVLEKVADASLDLMQLGRSAETSIVTQLKTFRAQVIVNLKQSMLKLNDSIARKLQLAQKIETQCNDIIRNLLLELETGGNARFEDEQKSAPWIAHCEKQIKKLIKRAASKDSPETIQIHRISRFHNRSSKLRFEERLKAASDSLKCQYLCYHPDPSSSGALSIAEFGFEASDCPLILTNYFDCFGTAPLHGKMRQAIIVRTSKMSTKEVFSDKEAEEFADTACIENSGFDAVFQNLDTRANFENLDMPKKYTLMSSECIVPEYLVEYSLETDLMKDITVHERLIFDIAYSNRFSHPNMPIIVQELVHKLPEESIQLHAPVLIPNSLTKYLDLAENAKKYFQIIIEKNINDIELNLTGIPYIPQAFFAMRNRLVSLTISNAELEEFPCISECSSLENLDLSFNKLHNFPLAIAKVFPKLSILDLTQNFYCLEEILLLSSCENLHSLYLLYNPVTDERDFELFAFNTIPSLKRVNRWADNDKYDYKNQNLEELLRKHSSTQTASFRPLSIRTSQGQNHSSLEQHSTLTQVWSAEAITTLELDFCFLMNLDSLPDMPALKWASFRNNYLVDITKLKIYKNLKELSLAFNRIHNIDCLAGLTDLEKLDVSNNRIESLEASGFESLNFLSLQNNKIKNLRRIAKISTLFELYIGDNQITHSFTTFPLKELPHLIILDLTGNDVCKLGTFRLFTIFHLSRLKILNGSGVSGKDQAAAKELYMGKLTVELLGEKIGHFNFKNITQLDLRNCKIKEIDCLSGSDFRNLRQLNFDNNSLTNIDCFASLSTLRCLSINNNKIERLFSTDGRQVSDLKPVRVLLGNLEELSLGYNNIARIADLGLHRLPLLRNLYLPGNRISKVDGLETMNNLVSLDLDKNQIRGIDPLSLLSLINLKVLHIKENRLKSLANFDCLPNLQLLFLTNNRIHEMSEIEKMKLPSILEISLASNAVCRKQLYRIGLVIRFPHIMAIDGRAVTNEERQRAHTFYLEQCIIRDDPAAKLIPAQSVSGQNIKTVVKIASVILDGRKEINQRFRHEAVV